MTASALQRDPKSRAVEDTDLLFTTATKCFCLSSQLSSPAFQVSAHSEEGHPLGSSLLQGCILELPTLSHHCSGKATWCCPHQSETCIREGRVSAFLARKMLPSDLVAPRPNWVGLDGPDFYCSALKIISKAVSLNETYRQIKIVKTIPKTIWEIKTTTTTKPSCFFFLQIYVNSTEGSKRTLVRDQREKLNLFTPPPRGGENKHTSYLLVCFSQPLTVERATSLVDT